MTTKQAPTSNNQRLMVGLSLNARQVADVYREADNRHIRAAVDAIALKCELMDETAKQATRARLLAMVPPPPQTVDLDSLLGALDGMPELPEEIAVPLMKRNTPNRKPKPAQTSTATVAGERVYCTSQPPVNPSTKRRILWVDSAQRSANGQTYINVGNGRRTIGATIEDWRAILIDHRDELLATLESLHNEASQA